jgi:hypothetical protein
LSRNSALAHRDSRGQLDFFKVTPIPQFLQGWSRARPLRTWRGGSVEEGSVNGLFKEVCMNVNAWTPGPDIMSIAWGEYADNRETSSAPARTVGHLLRRVQGADVNLANHNYKTNILVTLTPPQTAGLMLLAVAFFDGWIL